MLKFRLGNGNYVFNIISLILICLLEADSTQNIKAFLGTQGILKFKSILSTLLFQFVARYSFKVYHY